MLMIYDPERFYTEWNTNTYHLFIIKHYEKVVTYLQYLHSEF